MRELRGACCGREAGGERIISVHDNQLSRGINVQCIGQ